MRCLLIPRRLNEEKAKQMERDRATSDDPEVLRMQESTIKFLRDQYTVEKVIKHIWDKGIPKNLLSGTQTK